MEAIPRDVIECAILDGQIPQCGEGAEWCEEHANCYRCAKDIHDMMGEEVRRLKAERDRALAELDKALGEREDALLSASNAGFNEGFDAGYASADDWFAQNENAMREHGWIRLPLDADGEPVYVGDEMECITPLHPDVPKAFKVQRISLESSGWTLVAYPASYKPENCRHIKQPTVEDVLRKFAEGLEVPVADSYIAEYAAKLRLADE